MDNFEQRLSRQPMRGIPDNWRAEILDTARTAPDGETDRSFPHPVSRFLRELLWPAPWAWAGLAVAWIGIFMMHHETLQLAKESIADAPPLTRETAVALGEQRRMVYYLLSEGLDFDELLDRPKPVPRPRNPHSPLLLMAG